MRKTILTLVVFVAATMMGMAQYKMPALAYSHSALEPFMDSATVNVDYNKITAYYVDNLNKLVAQYPSLKGQSIEQLLANMNKLPSPVMRKIRDFGGGYYNNYVFWNDIAPAGSTTMSQYMKDEIKTNFGTLENLQKYFNKEALKRFGAGWTWVILMPNGKLQIVSTGNNDNTMMGIFSVKGIPVIACNMWEHAYLLKYKFDREAYLKAFWKVVNWNYVEKVIKANSKK